MSEHEIDKITVWHDGRDERYTLDAAAHLYEREDDDTGAALWKLKVLWSVVRNSALPTTQARNLEQWETLATTDDGTHHGGEVTVSKRLGNYLVITFPRDAGPAILRP